MKHEKDIKAAVEEAGLELVSITRRKHWKVYVRNANGTEYQVIWPVSTSDWRTALNKSAQLKKIARGV